MIKEIAVLGSLFLSGLLFANEAEETKVKEAIKVLVPEAKVDAIAKAPLKGFYEAVVGGQLIYVSEDGKYIMAGSLMDVEGKKNLTEGRYAEIRKSALAGLGADKRIVFPAKSAKHKITVFTDIDCGYCRKLHQHMAEFNDLGITVEYLFFPRAGLKTESFNKAVNVWCAADRNKALTQAKNGETVEAKTCANPVEEEFMLGQKIGVSGTPAIIAEDGSQIGGYLEPAQLIARLDGIKASQDSAASAKK